MGTPESQQQIIALGDGQFGPVPVAVWQYAVGGRNVVKSWFDYRKAKPAGRRGSPLDDIHVDSWEPDWTSEFIDLLTVLTRLVDLEPAQAELLAAVRHHELLTRADLATSGVRWPTGPADRKPLFSLANDGRATHSNAATLL